MSKKPTGARLAVLRNALGLTQSELGLKLYLSGKNPARQISRLENGTGTISGPIIRALEAIAKDGKVVLPWDVGT